MRSNRRTLSAAVATVLVSIALYPIFTGTTWFWAGAGAVVAVALAGTLTRLRRLPAAVCLAGGAAGLLLYLNLVFAHAHSLLLVIPTAASLSGLWHLAGQGTGEAARYAPPVPELAGMVLLGTGGIGLTALFTDLIAVRLRRASLAGLPLLLLFAEPFTLSVSHGWLGTTVVFCLGAGGYLTILGSEGRERIREWEQPGTGREPGELAARAPDTRMLAAAGRRVGIASVIVALCVPIFVPGLHATRLFGSGSPGIGGTGGPGGAGFPGIQNVVTTELRESRAVPVLTYTTSAAKPGYLQVYVLDKLTATGWQPFGQPESLVPVAPTLPSAPGLTDTVVASPVTTDITIARNVGRDSLSALAVPYPAVAVRASAGTIRADRDTLMVFDNGVRLGGLSYKVTSADVEPSPRELAGALPPPQDVRAHYLGVPRPYLALRSLARGLVTGASTPFAQAVALQDWFANGNFTYTLNAPTITNESGLANFLYTTHAGYCVQFAFAMAVLARLVGIPSRVAYGFTQGTHVSGSTWSVSTHDAHAWPELYFQGFGWLRFEPTPGGSAGQGTATTPAYAQQLPSAPSGSSSSVTLLPGASASSGGTGATGSRSAATRERALGAGAGGSQAIAPAPGGPGPWALTGLSLLGLLIIAVLVPGCTRLVVRRRRWRTGARAGDAGLARAAWLELRDDLTDYGAGYSPSETPRGLAARVTADSSLDADEQLRRLTMAAERASYSALPVSGVSLRADSTAVRRALAASASRRSRWHARLFPPSVITPVAAALSQAGGALGRLGLSGSVLPSRGKAR